MNDRTDGVYQSMVRCIEKHNMLEADAPVIACVSGGCDSVAMLLLLDRYGKEHGHPLLCAHFNHMLRGAESDGDCLFVRELCRRLEIPFYAEQGDVASFAEKNGLSLEDAARTCRYAYFEKLAARFQAKIAVAHNKNDKTETVLLNLARGTGVHGLRGIPYSRGQIIRPLLDVSRQELEQVCESYGVSFRTDSTNLQPFCKRNQVRLEILPFLREKLDPEIDEKLYRLSVLAEDDDSFLKEEAGKIFRNLCTCTAESAEIGDRTRYAKLPSALRRRICAMLLTSLPDVQGCTLFPGGQGITFSLIDRLDHFLLCAAVGASIELPKGIGGRVYHDRVILGVSGKSKSEVKQTACGINREIVACDYETVISLCRRSGERTAAFDYEKLTRYCSDKNCELEVRTRQAGDHFSPYKAEGGKKLKKFFIDAKIPADRRDTIPLLACENEILWICGVRRSNVAPIDKNTATAIIFSADDSI